MSQSKHAGSCHCGAVRFEVDLDLDKGVTRCNCSVCTKRAPTASLTKPENFRLLQGKEHLGVYSWGSMIGRYHFCKECGINLWGEGHLEMLGGAFVSINVNCLDGIDPAALPVVYFDGRHDNWQAGPAQKPWPVNP